MQDRTRVQGSGGLPQKSTEGSADFHILEQTFPTAAAFCRCERIQICIEKLPFVEIPGNFREISDFCENFRLFLIHHRAIILVM